MIEAESARAGRPGERDMWAWVQRGNRLRPPQELAKFHEVRINACAKQFGPDGEVLGPNPEAQVAFDQEVAIADSMQADIKRTLIGLGCLTEENVLNGSRRLEALARASAHPGIEPNSTTSSVYTPACADMMRTARRFNAQDAVFRPLHRMVEGIGPSVWSGSASCRRVGDVH